MSAGTTVQDTIDQAGGFVEPPEALLIGGYFGRWVAADAVLEATLTVHGMRDVGGVLGAGIVLALPASACGIAATAEVLRYLAGESAGQCGPCVNGLPAMASALEQLATGRPPQDSTELLARWAGLVRGRGACAHPDGAAALLTSALHVFADDVARHLDAPCGRSAGSWLEVPR